MITQEDFDKYAEHIKNVAAEQLADGGEMPPTIGVWMDAEPILWAFPDNRPSRGRAADNIMNVVRACIVGIGADAVTIANDTYQATDTTKLDGTEWETGDMQKAWESDSPDKKSLSEAIMVQYYDRLGDSAHNMYCYDRSSGSLVFGDSTIVQSNGVQGYIPDLARQFFAEPTMLDTIKTMAKLSEEIDLSVEAQALGGESTPDFKMAMEYYESDRKRAFLGQVCGVIKYVLAPMGCAVAIAINDKESAEYFERSLGNPDEVT